MTQTTTAPNVVRTADCAGPRLFVRSPDGLDTVQWRCHDDTVRTARPSPELLHERLWETEQIRRGVQYQNRLNQHGLYYWPRTGRHVWYESALELACLVQLDYQGEAAQIAAQPFRLLFRRGAQAIYHDPDFFAVHANGDQVLYDVKPAHRVPDAQAQFAETVRVCEQVGWRHEVVSETCPTRTTNLTFLRATRLPRCHPSSEVFRAAARHLRGRTIPRGGSGDAEPAAPGVGDAIPQAPDLAPTSERGSRPASRPRYHRHHDFGG
ncbi:TnsA-like heteromeric transposase endonuclease subunit [Rhodococcus sp. H29-C3]|uniref:TnsA-like heteromeric transposase endonuclease subunit n=1 Tax=Rhodococcus sp. H29-C3 TaxID=3046307 RepID=UPI0024BA1AF0|nr:TnsA-like heteromeric transposase endonuclease subunit [Rhodococcus sp. H29-C3]MDJ0362281.1 TnsA-like heteromeric transposase endonuclease subunit [Rhodococcus sp. H29-C3]